MTVRLAIVVTLLAAPHTVLAQTSAPSAAPKWEITDNSFLVEEAFNQEPGIVQNIFTWSRGRNGQWLASFTQEWPAPNITHQFSYTLPFSGDGTVSGINDVLLNYRYQLVRESAGRPAVAPRVSLILPTGREADGLGRGITGLQVNAALSKQFGDTYLHANAGWTWFPGVALNRDSGGTTANLTSPHVAGSAIWRVTPMFNILLEAVADFEEGVEDGAVSRSQSVTVSPGFRRGWNIGHSQIVVGAAVPVTRSGGANEAAALVYFSYELPFH